MGIPYRGKTTQSTYFVTGNVLQKRSLFQVEKIALLFIEVMLRYRAEIAVPIHYKSGMGLRYVSHCRIELDASVQNGLAVHTDREELVSGKPTQEDSEILKKMPRPYLEVEDSVIGEAWGKTPFKFTNLGGDVAHNVQVQPMVVDHRTVVFDPIPIIHVNETRNTLPNIPGGIGPLYDILNLMENEFYEAWGQNKLAMREETAEWEQKLIITYQDFAQRRFEATADLVLFPINRTLKNKHAFDSRQREYKTVEVRNIKFRPVP